MSQLLMQYAELVLAVATSFTFFLLTVALKRSWQQVAAATTEPDTVAQPAAPKTELEPWRCSLDITEAVIAPTCCLLQSKSGKSLMGSPAAARINKLQRLGVLIN